MAWLSGWAKRVKFTLDHTDIDETLTDFPVLLHLAASVGRNGDDVSFVFDELASDANRKKIAVQDDATGNECYAEIEDWNHAGEEAWLHSKVPIVHADSDDDLYLYFDSSHADNDAYVGDTNNAVAENVWDANFKAVYHMADGADNAHIYDSTSNNNDGTKKGANEPNEVVGLVGKAQDFDPTAPSDYIGVSDVPFDFTTQFTLEALINYRDTAGGLHGIFSKGGGIWSNMAYALRIIYDAWYEFYTFSDGSTVSLLTNKVATFGVWQLVTAVFQQPDRYVYVNGGSVVHDTWDNSLFNSSATLKLGLYADTSIGLDGLMGEARISDIARSAAWIKATKETLWDNLLDWGSEEAAPAAGFKGSRGFIIG